MGKKRYGLALFIFFTTTVYFVSAQTLYAEDALRLEGVIEDPANPSDALAIINGAPIKSGDSLGVYRVGKIQSQQVILIHSETHQEMTLYLKEKALPAPVSSPAARNLTTPTKAPKSFMEEARVYLKNPSKAVGRAWELKALRDLVTINNAAVHYYEKNKFFPVGMRQLTLDGYLPPEYEKGVLGKYQFYLKNTPMKPDDFQLHADPLEKEMGLRCFFVGADAVIRESLDGPAQANSSPHEYLRKKW